MKNFSISTLTICGIEELPEHKSRAVTNVLTILDPDRADPDAFGAYQTHRRTILRFHDIIAPAPERIVPERSHIEQIMRFGDELVEAGEAVSDRHLLVHCHMGISRSTAAMLILLAQNHSEESDEALFERLVAIRPQAWPNSLMTRYADEMLGRKGQMTEALARHYGRQLQREPKYREWMASLDRSAEVDMAVA